MPANATDDNDDLKHGTEAILLVIVSGPEGNHVVPQGSSLPEGAKPGQGEQKA